MLFNFLKKKAETNIPTQKAVIIFDHDHWHISLKKQFHIEANIQTLIKIISEKYHVIDIHAFGDFTTSENKLSELVGLTENIYDVRGDIKNDKDILILDKLYRLGVRYKGTDTTIIIVSGSGRLTLASRFLREECGLEIGIYSVRGCLSGPLKETANWALELPNDDFISMLFPLIINNCVHVSKKDNIIPTFKTTVEVVSSFNDVSPVLIEMAVEKMLELGYLYQKKTFISYDTVKTIAANWELLIKDGLYDPEND